ncbi:MAG: GGDEF domain-containing protein [Pseudomonas sp.]|uniref:sensor domain-containing diguanylate cyclase n=1 Tax=Pseudomonas sp. TaxID=306 RepID=UPI00273296EE|nr:GGDEF domain-containing protein [Pseudomonas sp.]MDP3847719.1 GGDEF domain-containing protein [Pseudomonas sp.]
MSQTCRLLSAVVGKLHTGVLIVDEQLRICFINQWLQRVLHSQSPWRAEIPLLELLPELEGSRLLRAINQALQSGLPSVLSPSLNTQPLPLFNAQPNGLDSDEPQPLAHSLQVIPLRQDGLHHCLIAVTDLSSSMRRERLLKAQAEKLGHQSLTDALTGIANRRRMNNHLEEEVRRAARSYRPLSVILLDIDHFKLFNDRFGHLAGDECLIRMALSLQARVSRAGDLLARYGGEEFCVILPDTDGEAAQTFAESLRCKVESLNIEHPDNSCAPVVTISLGVASWLPGNPETPIGLLLKADNALYRAKQQGRNCALSHVSAATASD